jgi:hypothetical protein
MEMAAGSPVVEMEVEMVAVTETVVSFLEVETEMAEGMETVAEMAVGFPEVETETVEDMGMVVNCLFQYQL